MWATKPPITTVWKLHGRTGSLSVFYISIVEWFLHTLQKLQNTVARRVGELKIKSVTHQNGTTSILSQTGPSRCRFWLLCLVEQQQYIDMNNTHQIWWKRTRFVEITSLQKGICRGNRGYVRVSGYVNYGFSLRYIVQLISSIGQ